MITKKKIHRWRPLMIGICVVLIFSASITWKEGRAAWGTRTYTRTWLLTASGLFGELDVAPNKVQKVVILIVGALNLLAIFSYAIRPHIVTKLITILGFIVWQFLGYLGPRMGI